MGGEYLTGFRDDERSEFRKRLYVLENHGLVKLERKKLKEKGCDIIVANSINSIDSDSISGYIINKKGEEPFNLLKEMFAWKLTESVEQLIT